MNRSILIVICDFLLVSLLAFSTIDINKVAQNGGTPQLSQPDTTAPTNQASGRQDLGDVMRLALNEERKVHDQLEGELTHARAVLTQQDQQIQNTRNQLLTKEQLAAELAAEQAKLQQQFAAAQTNIADLNQQLHATTVETVITKEQRAAMEVEAHKQAEKASALEQKLAQLQKANESMQSDRMALQSQLQMSEASNRSAYAQMSQLQEEVDSQRRENVRLAEGVKVLAAKSSDLAQEIRDTRPLTPNMIFEQMSTNRVLANFTGVKTGLFGGDSSKDKQAQLILVTDETNVFALCHVQDTPLTLMSPGTQWERLTGTLTRGSAVYPITSLSFCTMDPRMVLIPVPTNNARALGCKIYHFAKDPYVFQDAVLVGTREDYYGECKFQIDVSTPQYLKMDHNSLKGLFGKFNPSSGDLVLSKSGDLIGVMANNSYCAVIRHFDTAATLRFGPDGRNQPTALTLSTLYSVVTDMPFKLQ
ncbi:MAG TPA: hypothetical protein VK731_06570 [Candidatus Cybelea sp.]|nr:hypothetical protein [Candidatus Cybelea sp.]